MNATDTMIERPPRRGGLVGPAILVALGVVLLLNIWAIWVGACGRHLCACGRCC